MKAKKKLRYEELWSEIRDLIRLVTKNSNGSDYNEKYLKNQNSIQMINYF